MPFRDYESGVMKMRNANATRGLLVLLGLFGLSACGPISALSSVRKATIAIESAEVVEASKNSPYEYQLAVEYLKKAREEQGYSDYQHAVDLAQKALEFAEKAKLNSKAIEQDAKAQKESARPVNEGLRNPPTRSPVPVKMPIAPATPTKGVR